MVLEGYHDGDRDGGDTGGNPPQDIVQPPADTGDDRTDAAPEPWEPEEDDLPRRPETPEEDPEVSKPEPFQERVTETESLLSGGPGADHGPGGAGALFQAGGDPHPV